MTGEGSIPVATHIIGSLINPPRSLVGGRLNRLCF